MKLLGPLLVTAVVFALLSLIIAELILTATGRLH